jgi:cyclopropane fatty-acyl-phospholipid synthase-like methyltransferase
LKVIDKSAQYTAADGMIDVKKLIAAYSFEEHAERADKYFDAVTDPWAHHLRKPFTTTQECSATLSGLSALLQLLKLQPGHHVVDFGCGAGWLSSALALLQCQVTSIDISQRALDIARLAVLEHPFLRRQQIAFRRLEEARIPVDTSSVDRIICLDSFHHVADQKLYLQEFFRLLRPGGMVGFHEPGPGHSRCPGSQYEMRKYAVIENDIVIEDISAAAQATGFEEMNMAVFTDTPITMPPSEFLSLAGSGDRTIYEGLGSRLFAQAKGKSVFTLCKPGTERQDSRTASTLAAELAVMRQVFAAETRRLTVYLLARNTGTGAWLPSGGDVGAVNIGVRILTEAGLPITGEPIRFQLSNIAIDPGGSVQTDLIVDLAQHHRGDLIVEFDLVAEHVAWFSQIALRPLRVPLLDDR